MTRIKGTYRSRPGYDTDLSGDNINDEPDWHDAFEKRMEKAGWTLKHEETRNDGRERADFLAYHDKLNTSYSSGEWIGFELKYSNRQNTRMPRMAEQIEEKYLDGSWLSSGEDIALWVVAPYVEPSHTGDRAEMEVSRHRELEACNMLNHLGFGYLNSWHPLPHMVFDRYFRDDPFPEYEGYMSTPGIPAFSGAFSPFKHANCGGYEAQRMADMCRAHHSTSGAFTYDREAKGDARDKHGPSPDGVGE